MYLQILMIWYHSLPIKCPRDRNMKRLENINSFSKIFNIHTNWFKSITINRATFQVGIWQ